MTAVISPSEPFCRHILNVKQIEGERFNDRMKIGLKPTMSMSVMD
jgi:hypothetical protein